MPGPDATDDIHPFQQGEPSIDRFAVDAEPRSEIGQIEQPACGQGRVVDQCGHPVELADHGDIRDVPLGERFGVRTQPALLPSRVCAGEDFREATPENALDQVVRRAGVGDTRKVPGKRPVQEVRNACNSGFGLGKRQEFNRLDAPGKRVGRNGAPEQFHRAGNQKASRCGIGIDQFLEFEYEGGCALNFIDDRGLPAAHESDRVVQCEAPELVVIQGDEGALLIVRKPAGEGRFSGLARPDERDDAGVRQGSANSSLGMPWQVGLRLLASDLA